MNFGIMAGAFLAAGLAGRFDPAWRLPWRQVLGAALGGLLMGYGARLAFGCNIGAFFSGIASGSLHGWLWFVTGLAGSYLGGLLRPFFGLAGGPPARPAPRSEEHTSELQSLMRISYAVVCLTKKKTIITIQPNNSVTCII